MMLELIRSLTGFWADLTGFQTSRMMMRPEVRARLLLAAEQRKALAQRASIKQDAES